mmetsp:Transcript_10447/g.26818  ORF Transcript_10447/g.26818 Transcript_10447/m.26818 type:complete len:669 (+) Transcript_10447:311-2317(+)
MNSGPNGPSTNLTTVRAMFAGSDADVSFDADVAGLFGGDPPQQPRKRGSKSKKGCRKSGGKPTLGGDAGGSECKMIPPEPQDGNIEYKLKLCDKTAGRFQQLVTQMRWRLDEGEGIAVYIVGVTDAGHCLGIPESEFAESCSTLQRMATANRAEAVVEETWAGPNGIGGKVIVRSLPDESSTRDVRVVFMGEAQSGKSSLASVLSSTEIDDGRGRARLELFRHGHEIRSGRTSSVGLATLAFDGDGVFISPKQSRRQFNSQYQCDATARTVTLFDLPGDPKYYKTTLGGIMGRDPDLAVMVVSATAGVGAYAKELIGVAAALKIPLVAVVSKCDTCPRDAANATLDTVGAVCSAAGLPPPIAVADPREAAVAMEELVCGRATPFLCTSSVTSEGIEELRAMIGFVGVEEPSETRCDVPALLRAESAGDAAAGSAAAAAPADGADGGGAIAAATSAGALPAAAGAGAIPVPFEMGVSEVFFVAEAGPIVGGVVRTGSIKIGDHVEVGPFTDDTFGSVKVVGLRRNGEAARQACIHESVTLELDGIAAADVRQGQVLISPGSGEACASITTSVRLLALCEGDLEADSLQVVVIRGGIKRAASMTADKPVTAGGCTAATISFAPRAEFMRVGDTFLFKACRRGFTGYGVVEAVEGVVTLPTSRFDGRAQSV